MPGLARRGLTKVRPIGGLDSIAAFYLVWSGRRSIAKVRRIGAWVGAAWAD